MEVNVDNINEVFPKIRESIKNARFISMDTEFTALYLSEDDKQSLFDTPEVRYGKLRKLVSNTIPVQIGLTTFKFDLDNNCYNADCFVFYVWPRPFLDINQKLLFQASSFQFLCEHKFDFNKLIYKGLPFLNSLQENDIRKQLVEGDIIYSYTNHDLEQELESLTTKISKWFYTAKIDEIYVAYETLDVIINNWEFLYLLHKHLRRRFQDCLWTYEENGQLLVKKVKPEEFKNLVKTHNLESEAVDNALGFSRVFKLLVEYKKPLIGHNVLMDLMLLYNTFYKPLPGSYREFKKTLHALQPSIYDTKTLFFCMQRQILDSKGEKLGTLGDLYNYFRDSRGRHLALNSPLIDLMEKQNVQYDRFHDAGWDSYCTGYIFVRIAHIFAAAPYNFKTGGLTSTEHFAAVKEHENCINLIRCSVSCLRLNGDDPKTTRPPCLIAESVRSKNLCLSELSSLLSPHGYVELKKYGNKKALIAVDNYTSAKRILSKVGLESGYTIQKYNSIKHSVFGTILFWGGIVVSSGLIIYWTNKVTRK